MAEHTTPRRLFLFLFLASKYFRYAHTHRFSYFVSFRTVTHTRLTCFANFNACLAPQSVGGDQF